MVVRGRSPGSSPEPDTDISSADGVDQIRAKATAVEEEQNKIARYSSSASEDKHTSEMAPRPGYLVEDCPLAGENDLSDMHSVGEGNPEKSDVEEDLPIAEENVVSDVHGVGEGIPANSCLEEDFPIDDGNVVANTHVVGDGRPANAVSCGEDDVPSADENIS